MGMSLQLEMAMLTHRFGRLDPFADPVRYTVTMPTFALV